MPSMRAMGPACCCCPDFYVFTAGSSPYPQGFRKLYNTGEHPNNEVKIHEEGYTIPNAAGLVSMDHRHKRLFCYNGSGGTNYLQEYDTDVKNRRDIITFTRMGTIIGLATDWQHERLYYTKWITYPNPPTAGDTFEVEIRRVDYDGANDTLLHTETFTESTAVGLWGAQFLVWEPINNQLYYKLQHHVEVGASDPLHTFIKRMNADDGTGLTTLISRTPGTGGAVISGFGVSAARGETFWIESSSSGGAPFDLKVADLDCAGEAVIYTTSDNITRCFPNTKEERIYFESQTSPSGVATRTIHKIDYDGNNLATVFTDRQAGWARTVGSSYRSGQALAPAFGCRKELTGQSYAGCGYSGA